MLVNMNNKGYNENNLFVNHRFAFLGFFIFNT